MSVMDTNLVDYIYLEHDDGDVPVLVISDPLSWRPPDDRRHLWALREKIKTQIAFIETGQLTGVWPNYQGGKVRIQVYASCALSDVAHDFYAVQQRAMTDTNLELRVRLLDA